MHHYHAEVNLQKDSSQRNIISYLSFFHATASETEIKDIRTTTRNKSIITKMHIYKDILIFKVQKYGKWHQLKLATNTVSTQSSETILSQSRLLLCSLSSCYVGRVLFIPSISCLIGSFNCVSSAFLSQESPSACLCGALWQSHSVCVMCLGQELWQSHSVCVVCLGQGQSQCLCCESRPGAGTVPQCLSCF